MSTFIHKLGGSIIGNPRLLENVMKSIRFENGNIPNILVVSALNHSSDKSTGTTSLLSSVRRTGTLHEKVELVKSLHHNYNKVYEYFGESISDKTVSIIEDALFKGSNEETIEAGELASAQMVSDILTSRGIVVKQSRLPYTFKGRDVLFANQITRRGAIETLRSECRIPTVTTVMPGFFHVGSRGTLNTIGRGYSDVTGALAASVFSGRSYYVWKESVGVFTTHPGNYPNAKRIPSLSLNEARELTAFGNDVLHPLTSDFLADMDLDVIIKDADTERACDTEVLINRIEYGDISVPKMTAIASKSRLCIIDYKLAVPGSDLRFPFHPILLNVNRASVSALLTEESYAFLPAKVPSNFTVRKNRSVIACVGQGLRGSVGVASEITGTLAAENINVEMLSQGPDEISVAIVVATADERKAVESLEARFLA